ncbi:MAG: hypothetical protein IKY44_04935, partial [Clostridia bacterium]|nr:hypothetical protein [Clostridia bacterium]
MEKTIYNQDGFRNSNNESKGSFGKSQIIFYAQSVGRKMLKYILVVLLLVALASFFGYYRVKSSYVPRYKATGSFYAVQNTSSESTALDSLYDRSSSLGKRFIETYIYVLTSN